MSLSGFHQQLRIPLLYFFLGAGLLGCGVSTEDRPPSDTTTNIDGFSIIGNLPQAGITERFNLDMQSSNDEAAAYFDVSWEVQSSDPYTIIAHLSDDASTSFGVDDMIFLSTQCGSDELLYTCDFVSDQRCAFTYEPVYSYTTNSNGDRVRVVNPGADLTFGTPDDFYEIISNRYYLRCPHGGAAVSEANITTKMTNAGFPAASLNGYIVFTVCNAANDSCDYELVDIEVLDANP